ncbi:class I SAM-dependent methyltransferase [Mycobacterium yunnanensis]|uniref:Class I SAM-dependent methyltransferase n=1 Tax=Mycobacterium yunnanensis TaxID=368477 RepID=A0A9X3C324_9MYCO|nr:class I SAM-dependent methyltransferase [Mycobacterium yunnanensis]MCV7422196.1 class I SAM-dependent methyltransferase [Mycobacterium yunnanensis]
MTTPARDRFDEAYQSGSPPWVIGEPQPAVVALEQTGAIDGRVLDAGCGLGEHTILLATLGYDVLGVDFAPNAVAQARANAVAKGVDARFEVRDATALDSDPGYDTVVDSALFHVFGDDADRARYVASLHRAIRPGGLLHLLALSDAGRGFGPSVDERTIRAAFADGWEVESLDVTTYRGIVGAAHAEALGLPVGTVVEEPAWLARVRRR